MNDERRYVPLSGWLPLGISLLLFFGSPATAVFLGVSGALSDAGTYGTTLTRPDLFQSYYLEQIGLLLRNHRRPVVVGISDKPMALPFVIEEATAGR